MDPHSTPESDGMKPIADSLRRAVVPRPIAPSDEPARVARPVAGRNAHRAFGGHASHADAHTLSPHTSTVTGVPR